MEVSGESSEARKIEMDKYSLLTQREAGREVSQQKHGAQLNNFSLFPHKVLLLPSEVNIPASFCCMWGQRGGVMVMKGSVQN